MQDVLDCNPQLPDVPLGTPGATKDKKWDIQVSLAKLEGVLGKTSQEIFRPLSETVRDTVQSIIDRGLLK